MSRKNWDYISPVVLAAFVTASSPAPGYESTPELKQVEVACVNVSGLPAFTLETCTQFADTVRQGLEQVSEMTGGAIDPPQVRPRLLSRTVEIEDALDIRCINYQVATREQQSKIGGMVNVLTNAALEQVPIDPSQTGLVVTANAPPTLCRENMPPNMTERCTDTESRRAVLGGRALHHTTNRPAVFIFASGDRPKDLSLVRHERLHLGMKDRQLGHDFTFCNQDGDSLPTRIERKHNGWA